MNPPDEPTPLSYNSKDKTLWYWDHTELKWQIVPFPPNLDSPEDFPNAYLALLAITDERLSRLEKSIEKLLETKHESTQATSGCQA